MQLAILVLVLLNSHLLTVRAELINSKILVGNLLAHIIAENYRNCSITIISQSESTENNLSEEFNFLQLSLQQIPSTIHNIAVNPPNNFSISGKLVLKFIKNSCDLVLLHKSSPEFLPRQLKFISQLVFPRRLHQIMIIIMLLGEESLNATNTSNLLIQHDDLAKIPLKMEIILIKGHSGRGRALVIGKCAFKQCGSKNDLSGSGVNKSASIFIIGGYDTISGYLPYTKLFPESDTATLGQRNVSVVFPLDFFKTHKLVRPRLAFAQLQRVLFQTTNSTGLIMNHGKGSFVSSEPVGINYHQQLAQALEKNWKNNSMSLALIFFIDEPNPYHLQASTYYTYYRSTFIYRKMEQDKGNLLGVNFKRPVFQYLLPIAIGAAIIISMSQKWDLVTRSRLPKPINGEVWMRRSRKLRLSTFTNLLWEVAHNMAQQKDFPQLSLNKFTPSATVTLTLVTLFTIFVNWFMRLAPLADIVKPVPKFQLRSTDDILSLMKDNSKVMGRPVKIISAIGREELREIFAVSYKRDKNLVEKLLNETEVNVNPSECLEKAKVEDGQIYVICIGILNILARAMIFDNAADTHNLDVREVGSMKFCSYAFSPEFPYVHLFSRKISQLVQSGIADHWVDEALAATERESRRNSSKFNNSTKTNNSSSGSISELKNNNYGKIGSVRKDPISVQLINMVITSFIAEYPTCCLIFCVELGLGYWSRIKGFAKGIWLCLKNIGKTFSRKISQICNFMWESNQD